jgi:hypothetical protein
MISNIRSLVLRPRRRVERLLLVVALLLLAGCPGEKRPMTRDEIFAARVKVPTLYLTDDGREIVAEGTQFGAIVDPQTKKLAWAAYQCDNPQCPGKPVGERPYLFTWPNPVLFAGEDGTVQSGQPISPEELAAFEKFKTMVCPACEAAKTPNPNGLMPRRYVLPEGQKRLDELELEYKQWIEREEQRKRQSGQS